MARKPGTLKTYSLVSELLKKAVSEKGQVVVAKETGLAQSAISRYCRGIGEPTQSVLERLAVYFKVTVGELRGDGLSELAKSFQVLLETASSIGQRDITQHNLQEHFDKLKISINEYLPNADADLLMNEIIKKVKKRLEELAGGSLIDYSTDLIKKLTTPDLIDIAAIIERWPEDEVFRCKVKLLLDDFAEDEAFRKTVNPLIHSHAIRQQP